MSRTWTEEQKKEFSEKMKARWAGKKRPAPQPITDEFSATNPIANDLVETPILPRRHFKSAPPPVEVSSFSTSDLIQQLEGIPLPQVSYEDTGLLLNAMSAAATKIGLARRQKQEQLEAGTHRAPCKTCGRMIDISKPGGFQILTERDEHFMPKNSYYCSQNCLLARNMPSHARSTPREKRENQA